LVHDIPSNGKSISKKFIRNEKRIPLNYDKYLIGRSYQLFKCALHSDKTLQVYKQYLWHFCNFLELTTEEINSKYTGDNIKEVIRLQRIVEDYVLFLQAKISSGEITAGTAHTMIPPVKLFCEMNDIILNWRKINKLLPYGSGNAADEAYTREQIKKMLEHSDLRAKIPILFMASSGMRLGGFVDLRDGDIRPIFDEMTGKKLVAAHVVVYRGTDDEYDTFISPEAFSVYQEYQNLRIKFGENITRKSPILLRRFDISPDGKTATLDNTRPVALSTVAGIIRTVAYKAGIREVSENYKDRYNIKIAHGFRKFFNTTLSNVRTKDGRLAIDFIRKEMMMVGHALMNIHALEENYNRSDRPKMLLEDYLKAVSELTISDEERMKVEVKKLQTDISNMKSVEVELSEKDKEIQSMKQKYDEMSVTLQSILSVIGNVEQPAKNKIAKQIIMKGEYKPDYNRS
jgi:integrase